MKTILPLLLLNGLGAWLWAQAPDSTHTQVSVSSATRVLTQVAEGVYVIQHPDAPDEFPQGNTTVIIGEEAVLVVDACYLPSSAREDIAQIARWTDKPVRYLLNTHWHYDHTLGNGTYAAAFPGLTILAHIETRKQMEGYNPGWFARYPGRAALFQQFLDSGKDPDGKPLSETDRQEYQSALAGLEPVQAEFKTIVDRLPNLSFDHSLFLDLGQRQVEIRHLGRGNTAGDAVVWLPKEKIVVVGDVLDYPVPYLGGGYPAELAGTLKQLALLGAETAIPGHGPVLGAQVYPEYLHLVTEFVETVVGLVSREVYRLGSSSNKLEEVEAAVLPAVLAGGWRQKFAGNHVENGSFFDGFSLPGLIKAAYQECWRR